MAPSIADVESAGDSQRAQVVNTLLAIPGRRYAVLDAARSDDVLRWIQRSQRSALSLYDGPSASALASVCPYLVSLGRDPRVVEDLVKRSWGQAWGIFVGSRATLPDLRRHLRRFLVVVGREGRVLFRFYDPRVLRRFIPACTPDEARLFCGPLTAIVLESEDGEAAGWSCPGAPRDVGSEAPSVQAWRPFQLTEAHAAAFAHAAYADFQERMCDVLRAAAPEQALSLGEAGLREFASGATRRAHLSGLRIEHDVTWFALLLLCFDPQLEVRHPDLVELLATPTLSSESKARRLRIRLRRLSVAQ